MRRISFDFSKIYKCDNGAISQVVVFCGMIGENFVFIPYNQEKKHYCGAPCVLSEKEAIRMITQFTR